MRRRGALAALLLALITAGAAIYLRDPAWLIDVESGFLDWEQTPEGRPFRWMSTRASFFVPSDADSIVIPFHALFDTDDHSPFTVVVSVNDRPATQVTLRDEEWQEARVPIVPLRGWSRRVMRIDFRANRIWSQRNVSVQVGEIGIER